MGHRVLVCDDDPGTLRVVTLILQNAGHEAVLASSGAEAIALASQQGLDAILLDLMMPEKNGWETLETLKHDPATRGIPVIVLSVLSPAEAQVVREHYVGWVQKPIDENALLRAVERVTGSERRPRILVVEDDPVEAQVFVRLFESDGLEVLYAPRGSAAVALTRLVVPDIILLDLGLPDVDGFDVLETIRRDPALCTVPVVVYTGREVGRADRERLSAGRTEFLTKARTGIEELEREVLRHLPVGPGR